MFLQNEEEWGSQIAHAVAQSSRQDEAQSLIQYSKTQGKARQPNTAQSLHNTTTKHDNMALPAISCHYLRSTVQAQWVCCVAMVEGF